MGKHGRKQKKRSSGWLLALCAVVLAGLLILFLFLRMPGKENEAPSPEEPAPDNGMQTPAEDKDPDVPEEHSTGVPVEFPVVLDEGRMEVQSLFPFSGVNPDAGKQDAEDAAAILLRNTSEQYLREAALTLTFDDGTERLFFVQDVPAGADVMVFSVSSERLLAADLCTGIAVDATYEDTPGFGSVGISVEGLAVTVTNRSTGDLTGIDVYYRDVFDDKYFGGITYTYRIEQLSAGESTVFTAGESLLGLIDVVRVAENVKN